MSELSSGLASTANTTTAPSAAPAAPAPASAPATPPASAAPPRSMSEALQQAGYGQEEPHAAPEQTEASTPAPATVEPPPVETSAEPAPGEPPKERWADILTNQREKARQEVIQQVQTELEPIRPVLPVAQAIARDVQTGTLDGLNQLLAEYAQHPQLGPQLRSMFGRALAQMRGQAPSAEASAEQEPQADLVGRDANGQEVAFYSADQQRKWQQWNAQQQRQAMSQELAPLREIARERQVEQVKTHLVKEAMQRYQPLAAEVMEMPGFTAHKAEIAKRQQELFEQSLRSGRQDDPMQLLMRAYREIVPGKLQAQQQEQLIASATAKAAGRDANPARVAGSPPPPPKSMAEALRQAGVTF